MAERGQRNRHGDRHPGRAVAARFGPAMAAAAAYARSLGAKAVLALASDDLVTAPRNSVPACRDGPPPSSRADRHLRHPADRTQDRLRLYPARQRISAPCRRSWPSSRSPLRNGARYIEEGLLWSSRFFLFPPGRAVGDGELPAAMAAAPSRPWPRRRRLARRCSLMPILRQGAGQVDRLRRNGAHRQVPGRAGEVPLVRPRHLGRAARYRPRRQRRATSPRARSRSTMCATPMSARTGR